MGTEHNDSVPFRGLEVALVFNFPIVPLVISNYQKKKQWCQHWTVTFLGLMPLT